MTVDGFRALDHPEPVLLLHTSGASGNMKYIGGIVRNLFTSILSGGSVISCNGLVTSTSNKISEDQLKMDSLAI